MKQITKKALELAKKHHQVIGRTDDYYVTLEQLNILETSPGGREISAGASSSNKST